MRLFFITEGSENSGLGHLYRVNSFALKCLEQNASILIWANIPKDLAPVFSDLKDFLVKKSPTKHIPEIIRAFKPDYIIFDLLNIDTLLFDEIKKLGIKTVSLSPIFNKLDSVDYLFTRGNLNYPAGPKIFSGIEYVIIGNHVKRINELVYKSNIEAKQFPVAVTLGGSDAPNKTLKIIETLVKYNRHLLIWVLLGEGYRHSYTQLVNVIKQNPLHEIILVRTNHSMWNILQNTVLAITSGGITAFEAAVAGLPTINIVANDMHKNLLSDLVSSGVACISGVFPNYDEQKLIETIDNLNSHRDQLFEMHKKTKIIASRLEQNLIFSELQKLLVTEFN